MTLPILTPTNAREKVTVILLDYGRVVAPEDGDPPVQFVYGARADDQQSYKLFGSLRHDLAKGTINEEYVRDRLQESGVQVPADYAERWQVSIEAHMRPTPGMEMLIGDLKNAGYRVALLSNVWPMSARIIKQNNWYDMFDSVYLSCDLGMAKPDKEIYDFAVQDLGADSRKICYVDDKQDNLTYPAGMGMETLCVNGPVDAEKVLRERFLNT